MTDLDDQLLSLRGYSYQVWEYSPMHSSLTIRATNKHRANDEVYILFGMVEYVELAMIWEGDFIPASDDEYLLIFKKSRLDLGYEIHPIPKIREILDLYKVERPRGNIYILGSLSSIKTEREKNSRNN
jgi:hypothetical protein